MLVLKRLFMQITRLRSVFCILLSLDLLLNRILYDLSGLSNVLSAIVLVLYGMRAIVYFYVIITSNMKINKELKTYERE